MPEPLKPSQGKNGSATILNASREPKAYDVFFRFRPVAFMKHLVKLAESKNSAQQKRDTYTDAIRRACLGLIASTVVRVLVIVGIGLLSWYLLYSLGVVTDENGRADPNWLIAIVTTLMVVLAYLQWSAISVQSAEFIRQNEIMIKQTDAQLEQNELTREQMAQARAQMKLENRAWLGITDAQIRRLEPGANKVKCTITIKNSGKTPGKIIAGLVKYYVHPINYPEGLVSYEFEAQPLDSQVHNINPGEGMIIERSPLGEVDNETIKQIGLGLKQLHVLAYFDYRDISGEKHNERGFYTLIGLGPEMYRRANYCGGTY